MEVVSRRRHQKWFAAVVSILAAITLSAACTAEAPAGETWTFRATSVRIDDMQDLYVPFLQTGDDPYLINIGFRVKFNQPGSAQAWVVNARSSAPTQVPEGSTRALSGGQQAAVNFSGVQEVDVLDLLNESNKLEVVGVYTWAIERDVASFDGTAANSVAGILRNVLNDTVAKAQLPSNFEDILGMLVSNLGPALGVALGNLSPPLLGDDMMGGSLHIGVAARGTLGDIIRNTIGTTPLPAIDIPLISVPPGTQGGNFFVTSGSTVFNQSYTKPPIALGQGGGKHTYNFEILKTS